MSIDIQIKNRALAMDLVVAIEGVADRVFNNAYERGYNFGAAAILAPGPTGCAEVFVHVEVSTKAQLDAVGAILKANLNQVASVSGDAGARGMAKRFKLNA